MLPRSLRVNTALFKDIIEKGRFSNGKYFLFRYIKTAGTPRLAISVSKKVLKNAVDRNKIRRRLYSLVRNIIKPNLSAYNIIIFPKHGIDKLDLNQIITELKSDFVKIGFLK